MLQLMINSFETHHATIHSSSLLSLDIKLDRDLLYNEMVVSCAYSTYYAELRCDGKSKCVISLINMTRYMQLVTEKVIAQSCVSINLLD